MYFHAPPLQTEHFGPVVTLQPSPFFADVFLSAGDWTVKLWKLSAQTALLISPCASNYITVARWSHKRPGVFFVGKADGTVDIWDLLDKSHSPSITQNVCSPSPITSIEFLSETIYHSNVDTSSTHLHHIVTHFMQQAFNCWQ